MKLHSLPLAMCFILSLFAFESGLATNIENRISNTELSESEPLESIELLRIERGMLKQNSKSKDLSTLRESQESEPTQTSNIATDLPSAQEKSEIPYKETPSQASMVQVFNIDSFGLGMYYGFAAMVILLNLICFLVFSEKVFLYFSIASGAMMIFYSLSDGIIGMEMTSDPLYISSLLLVIVAACSALFSNHYLNLKEFYPKMRIFSTLLLGAAGFLALGGLITNEVSFSLISRMVSFTVLISFFAAGVW
ncbi:MAG: hypothetical protein HKM28_06150, partial [Flavobacteriaceae bacterium]|nr:hypothetical protein [Flavobacteriaceae bacterium]